MPNTDNNTPHQDDKCHKTHCDYITEIYSGGVMEDYDPTKPMWQDDQSFTAEPDE